MTYLITQIFIFLLLAGLLGMALGWYLTRIAAAGTRASLEARIDKALAQAGELRSERDSATAAAENSERERRLLSDEANRLRAELDAARAAPGSNEDVDGLRAELDDCRQSLAALTAPATGNDQAVDTAAIASAAAAAASGIGSLLESGSAEPAGSEGPADDLQKIKGIGPKIAGILHELGIRQYAQIAAWNPDNVAWVNEHLRFKGRVERERWIEQARALIEGD